MKYSFDKLKSDVMVRLGEIARPLPSGVSSAVPGPAEVVGAKVAVLLPEVGSRLIREASVEMLGGGILTEVEVAMVKMPCGLYAAEIHLPEGFLRLVSVRMSGWERSACGMIYPGMPEWGCQWSREEGIAGNPEKPQVYFDGDVLRAVGSRVATESLAWFRCCKIPRLNEDGEFEFPDGLYTDLVAKVVEQAVL